MSKKRLDDAQVNLSEIKDARIMTEEAANLVKEEGKINTLTEFMDAVMEAKLTGQEWIEVSPKIIQYYNKNGLGSAKYFIFQGIKVCNYGESEKIQAEMEMSWEDKLGETSKLGKIERTHNERIN
jgi:hypothetical protein